MRDKSQKAAGHSPYAISFLPLALWSLIVLVAFLPGCLRQDILPDVTPPPVVVDPVDPVTPDTNDPLRVLILYEQDDLKHLPPSQVDALQSLKVLDWLDSHGADYRIWDQHVKTQFAPEFWQQAVQLPHGKLPWIWISGKGHRGVNGAFPESTDAVLQLLDSTVK